MTNEKGAHALHHCYLLVHTRRYVLRSEHLADSYATTVQTPNPTVMLPVILMIELEHEVESEPT